MQRIKFTLVTTTIIVLILMGTLIYFLASNLGQGKNLVTHTISKNINLRLDFDSVQIDWFKLIQIRPAISIKNLLIANPPGYNNINFLEAKELHAELSLLKPLQKKIHINKIIVSQANIMLEQNSLGNKNPAPTFYGAGEYSFDNHLNYHLLPKVMTREVPIHISGTADKPKLNLDAKQFTINEVQKQLQPLADKLLNQFLPKVKEVINV